MDTFNLEMSILNDELKINMIMNEMTSFSNIILNENNIILESNIISTIKEKVKKVFKFLIQKVKDFFKKIEEIFKKIFSNLKKKEIKHNEDNDDDSIETELKEKSIIPENFELLDMEYMNIKVIERFEKIYDIYKDRYDIAYSYFNDIDKVAKGKSKDLAEFIAENIRRITDDLPEFDDIEEKYYNTKLFNNTLSKIEKYYNVAVGVCNKTYLYIIDSKKIVLNNLQELYNQVNKFVPKNESEIILMNSEEGFYQNNSNIQKMFILYCQATTTLINYFSDNINYCTQTIVKLTSNLKELKSFI